MLELSFEGFEPVLPFNAWDSIEAKLDAKRKRGFVWWHAAAILIGIAGLSILGKYFIETAKQSDSVATEKIQPANQGASSDKIGETTVPSQSDNLQNNNHSQSATAPFANNSNAAATQVNKGKKAIDHTSAQNAEEYVPQRDASVGAVEETVESKESLKLDINPMDIGYGLIEKADVQKQENSEALKFNFPLKYATGGRFLLGASVGQVVNTTNFTINSDYSNYVHRNFKKHVSEGEGLLGSVNVGLMAAYRVRSHWFVYTGLNLIQRKNSVNYQFSDAYPTVVSFQRTPDKFGNYPIVGYGPVGSVSTNYKGINSFSQMDIPIGAMREFHINKKWFFLPSVGLNYSIVTSTEGTTLDYQTLETTQLKTEWLRKSMVSTFAGMGIYRNLGYSLKIGMNLSGNYMVTSMYVPGATIKPRAFTGGLSTQLIWRID